MDAIKPTELLSALTRLLGPPVRQARHGAWFRIKVQAKDGPTVAVHVEVSTHRDKVTGAVLRNVADCLVIGRRQIEDVLADWTPEQLRSHLEQFTQQELKPPHIRHR